MNKIGHILIVNTTQHKLTCDQTTKSVPVKLHLASPTHRYIYPSQVTNYITFHSIFCSAELRHVVHLATLVITM